MDHEPIIATEGTRCVVVDEADEICNVVIAPVDWDPGQGLLLVEIPPELPAEIGDQWVAGELVKSPPAERAPSLEERVAALERQSNGGQP